MLIRNVAGAAVALTICAVAGCPPDGPPPVAHVVIKVGDGSVCEATGDVCNFDYGVVDPAAGASHEFTIDNDGTGPATINSIELFGDAVFTTGDAPVLVPAGASATFTVDVNPLSTKKVTTSLSLSWQPPENIIRVNLSAGTDLAPRLEFDPPACIFENALPDQVADCFFSVTNKGNDTLEVDATSVVGNVQLFVADGSTITFPVFLAPEQALPQLQARTFGPNPPGFASGDVVVESNDPVQPSAALTVSIASCLPPDSGCSTGNDCCQDPTQLPFACLQTDPDAGGPSCQHDPLAGEGEGEGGEGEGGEGEGEGQ